MGNAKKGRKRKSGLEGRKKNEDDDEQMDTEKEGETVDEGRRRTGRVGNSR